MSLINSLFMVSDAGDVFLEKHWKSPLTLSVLDPFQSALAKASVPEDIPPCVQSHRHTLLSIYRGGFFMVAAVQHEVPPLAVFEFLHRVGDIVADYFGHLTVDIVTNNCVMVFEVLEEMMDNGYPLSTENNVLKELIHPPSVIKAALNAVSGKTSNVSQKLPSGQLSNIPWRKSEVWYTTNDIYVDVLEKLECILDRNGNPIVCDILGHIVCTAQLSGNPDLVMSFSNARMFEDTSLHPCVRYRRWEQERVLSFVPPDGTFTLMTYRMDGTQAPIPLQIRPFIQFNSKGGTIDINVSRKHVAVDKNVEDVAIVFTLPKGVASANLTCNHGSYSFNPSTNVVRWEMGKVSSNKFGNLKGSLILQPGVPVPSEAPNVHVHFKVPGLTFSGLQVARLEMYNEKYKPFKGVKYIASAAQFIVRTF